MKEGAHQPAVGELLLPVCPESGFGPACHHACHTRHTRDTVTSVPAVLALQHSLPRVEPAPGCPVMSLLVSHLSLGWAAPGAGPWGLAITPTLEGSRPLAVCA